MRLSRILWLALAVLLGAGTGAAQAQMVSNVSPIPSIPFSRYPVALTHGHRASLVLRTADDRSYPTRLREAYRQPINFAGHFVVADWGCGTECGMGAVIDTLNGRVVWLPGTVCCVFDDFNYDVENTIDYRPDSALLILRGRINEQDGTDAEHYYRIVGDRFVHLRDVPLPTPLPDPSQ